MTGDNGLWIERNLRLAACAAQIADAIATAIEQGDEYSLAIGPAMDKIDGWITPHTEAAIIMFALWLRNTGVDIPLWRDKIPLIVSILAVSESE